MIASSSLRYDTSVKLPLYAERGVPEVWIVDVEGGRLRRDPPAPDQRSGPPRSLTSIVPGVRAASGRYTV